MDLIHQLGRRARRNEALQRYLPLLRRLEITTSELLELTNEELAALATTKRRHRALITPDEFEEIRDCIEAEFDKDNVAENAYDHLMRTNPRFAELEEERLHQEQRQEQSQQHDSSVQDKENIDTEGVSANLTPSLSQDPYVALKLEVVRQMTQQALSRSFTTGCRRLDALLGGGVPLGHITEVAGESSAGKTQLLMQLALSCQLPQRLGGITENNTPNRTRVLFVSTEAPLSSRRLQEMQYFRYSGNRSFQQKVRDVRQYPSLDNIVAFFLSDWGRDAEELLFRWLPRLFASGAFKLLIIDSISHHLRANLAKADYEDGDDEGTKVYQTRYNLYVARLHRRLQTLAQRYGAAVVVSNQVTSVPMEEGDSSGDPSGDPLGNLPVNATGSFPGNTIGAPGDPITFESQIGWLSGWDHFTIDYNHLVAHYGSVTNLQRALAAELSEEERENGDHKEDSSDNPAVRVKFMENLQRGITEAAPDEGMTAFYRPTGNGLYIREHDESSVQEPPVRVFSPEDPLDTSTFLDDGNSDSDMEIERFAGEIEPEILSSPINTNLTIGRMDGSVIGLEDYESDSNEPQEVISAERQREITDEGFFPTPESLMLETPEEEGSREEQEENDEGLALDVETSGGVHGQNVIVDLEDGTGAENVNQNFSNSADTPESVAGVLEGGRDTDYIDLRKSIDIINGTSNSNSNDKDKENVINEVSNQNSSSDNQSSKDPQLQDTDSDMGASSQSISERPVGSTVSSAVDVKTSIQGRSKLTADTDRNNQGESDSKVDQELMLNDTQKSGDMIQDANIEAGDTSLNTFIQKDPKDSDTGLEGANESYLPNDNRGEVFENIVTGFQIHKEDVSTENGPGIRDIDMVVDAGADGAVESADDSQRSRMGDKISHPGAGNGTSQNIVPNPRIQKKDSNTTKCLRPSGIGMARQVGAGDIVRNTVKYQSSHVDDNTSNPKGDTSRRLDKRDGFNSFSDVQDAENPPTGNYRSYTEQGALPVDHETSSADIITGAGDRESGDSINVNLMGEKDVAGEKIAEERQIIVDPAKNESSQESDNNINSFEAQVNKDIKEGNAENYTLEEANIDSSSIENGRDMVISDLVDHVPDNDINIEDADSEPESSIDDDSSDSEIGDAVDLYDEAEIYTEDLGIDESYDERDYDVDEYDQNNYKEDCFDENHYDENDYDNSPESASSDENQNSGTENYFDAENVVLDAKYDNEVEADYAGFSNEEYRGSKIPIHKNDNSDDKNDDNVNYRSDFDFDNPNATGSQNYHFDHSDSDDDDSLVYSYSDDEDLPRSGFGSGSNSPTAPDHDFDLDLDLDLDAAHDNLDGEICHLPRPPLSVGSPPPSQLLQDQNSLLAGPFDDNSQNDRLLPVPMIPNMRAVPCMPFTWLNKIPMRLFLSQSRNPFEINCKRNEINHQRIEKEQKETSNAFNPYNNDGEDDGCSESEDEPERKKVKRMIDLEDVPPGASYAKHFFIRVTNSLYGDQGVMAEAKIDNVGYRCI